MTELARRCAAFWGWFTNAEPQLRAELGAAIDAKDYRAMQALVDRVAEQLAAVAPGIAVRLSGGKGSFGLAISSPESAAAEVATQLLAVAPTIADWTFGSTVASPPANVIVRDDAGRELTVAFADVRFALLPPKPDGTVSVLFVIPTEFDPRGDLGHLYRAAAVELIRNAFGASPPGMGSFALVPASMLGDRKTRPVSELASAWASRA